LVIFIINENIMNRNVYNLFESDRFVKKIVRPLKQFRIEQ